MMPSSPPWACPILETWLGPCYRDNFSAEAYREVEPLHWGIRREGDEVKPIGSEAQQVIDEDLRKRFKSLLESVDADDKKFEAEAFDAKNPEEARARATLALIILCDQFSRNIYRKQPEAFRMDTRTAQWTLRLIHEKLLDYLHPTEAIFALLPLEHSESPENHRICLETFESLVAKEASYPDHVAKQLRGAKKFAEEHAAVVMKFNRYPHRNQVLKRTSTPEEIAFLETGPTWGQ